MIVWLPIAVLVVAQVILRLIDVAAAMWQERARANSHCAQMRTASAGGVALFERRRDGASLVIVPQGLATRDGDAAAGATGPGPEEAPVA
jgi:hypothetical protein